MIIKNDRKIRWGSAWQDIDIDNRTIKNLRLYCKNKNTHFLKILHQLLEQLYTVEANKKFIVVDFGIFGHSVFDGTEHKTIFKTSSLKYNREKYSEELAICTLEIM